MKVAQISRTIARALGLNEDAAEAIALAHDLGHPPFGHTGEETLNELMKDHGGFEHNAHSLRIVEELERRYPGFRGLNLTWEVREGIAKHNTEHDKPGVDAEYDMTRAPALEAQIVDIADEIAYNNHDIDDGLSSEMLSTDALNDVALWRECYKEACDSGMGLDAKMLKYQTIRSIINQQVTDLVGVVTETLDKRSIDSVEDVRQCALPIACFSPRMDEKNKELKRFLLENLYNHHRVLRMADKAKRILADLYRLYDRDPRLLPPHHAAEGSGGGGVEQQRIICDYIAGMTDRFALVEYKKLFDPYEKV